MSKLDSFASMHEHLTSTYPPPVLPPGKPNSDKLTPSISALQLHPTLEAALHLLNNDLPSAHFLVRHMQSAPAYEGMFLHGILHRIEGDYDNARCWYSDVQHTDLYAKVWGKDGQSFKDLSGATDAQRAIDLNAGQRFLNEIHEFRKLGVKDRERLSKLEQDSRRELKGVIDWCGEKFGTAPMLDASSAWVRNNEGIKAMGQDQVTGGSGNRTF